jgi:hypothetical protein
MNIPIPTCPHCGCNLPTPNAVKKHPPRCPGMPVFECPGWPIDGVKVHEVLRYRVGSDGAWVTLATAKDVDTARIINARRAHTLSHSVCNDCHAAMVKEIGT